MTIWGIGAYLTSIPPEDVVRFFLNNGVAFIGHDLSKHPRLKELRKKIRLGDLIFIKSRHDYSKPLRIKGIGIVTDADWSLKYGYEDKEGIKVYWVKDLSGDDYVEIPAPNKYGSTHTLYQETDPTVIENILNSLYKEKCKEKTL
ncbi:MULTISPECIES: hypothetical protein [Eubacteriales]|uniref:hypothetical protein n=1 Tax=Eubacteriales TaxID=186802 RepID=UPI00085C80FE|nr:MULTISPECIES: hypothetical protein [Eubacteriales]